MLIPFDNLFQKYNLNLKGVLHVGANVGEEFEMYNKLGLTKQIWIEGNPEIFLKLKQNISSNPHAVALNYIVGDKNKNVTFHISNNGSQSSSVLELGEHKNQHPDVYYVDHIDTTMHRIDCLDIDLSGVDFLNMDLQGYELQALWGMGDLLTRFKAAYMEVNQAETYKGCAHVRDLEAYLRTYGFRMVESKWVGIWGDALFVK